MGICRPNALHCLGNIWHISWRCSRAVMICSHARPGMYFFSTKARIKTTPQTHVGSLNIRTSAAKLSYQEKPQCPQDLSCTICPDTSSTGLDRATRTVFVPKIPPLLCPYQLRQGCKLAEQGACCTVFYNNNLQVSSQAVTAPPDLQNSGVSASLLLIKDYRERGYGQHCSSCYFTRKPGKCQFALGLQEESRLWQIIAKKQQKLIKNLSLVIQSFHFYKNIFAGNHLHEVVHIPITLPCAEPRFSLHFASVGLRRGNDCKTDRPQLTNLLVLLTFCGPQ